MSPQINERKKTAVILDTSAFIAGFDPFSLLEPQLTVPKVEEEISRSSIVNTRFRAAIENRKLKVRAPHPDFLKAAKVSASSLGDSYLLSEADMQLLALALELKAEGFVPQIVTDDYSIQNVASQMEIRFVALATFGIKRLLEWIRYCPACHRDYPADCASKECLICGTRLKRKPRRNVKNLKAK